MPTKESEEVAPLGIDWPNHPTIRGLSPILPEFRLLLWRSFVIKEFNTEQYEVAIEEVRDLHGNMSVLSTTHKYLATRRFSACQMLVI
ncbi:MAG: hypothetical protein VYC82_07620, partial [Verrucomicrobiota bacterium]|nr:hypothetical protein [Verrucomicrobiota bacterium]